MARLMMMLMVVVVVVAGLSPVYHSEIRGKVEFIQLSGSETQILLKYIITEDTYSLSCCISVQQLKYLSIRYFKCQYLLADVTP